MSRIRWYLGLGVILFSWSVASGLAAQDGAVDDSATKVATARRIQNKLVIAALATLRYENLCIMHS